MKNKVEFYSDGTVGFVGATGRRKRVTAEDIRAEDLAMLSKEERETIIDMVSPDNG